ncbi:hypothetical protein AB3N61_10445 [Leptospira sp. WS58.C1]|uniref:hypothetical protein n=1 Tax=Leptospira TaxID=171 RepID=UPI0002C02FBF|nr:MULTISPECIES: hypothetical protein [unclassified Leptospira]EMJ98524.1 hypothetical protein LEP1GSC192_0232 [Leptospira sp. B5-022]MCR1792677.1 hypothetical protein [Leptospira sp. id769339]
MNRVLFILLIFSVFTSLSTSPENKKEPHSPLNLIIPFDWFPMEPFAGGIFAAKNYNESASVLITRKELIEPVDQGALNKELQMGIIDSIKKGNGRILEFGESEVASRPAFRVHYKDKGSNLHILHITLFKENVMYGIMFFCMGTDPGKRYDVQKMVKKAYFRVDA